MIIPFAIPVDNQVINLAHIVSVKVRHFDTEPHLELVLKMTDGQQFVFSGKQAEIINREIGFAVAAYRAWQSAVTQPESSIIHANGVLQ